MKDHEISDTPTVSDGAEENSTNGGTLNTAQDVLNFYIQEHGEEPPPLSVGNKVSVKQYGPRVFTVLDLRAGGMLVDCVDDVGQKFCLPRYQANDGWVIAHA